MRGSLPDFNWIPRLSVHGSVLSKVGASSKAGAFTPWENGYAESFHPRLRDELLNAESFANLREAQALGTRWQREYNEERPHSSLGYLTPHEFAAGLADLPVGATPLPADQPLLHHEQRTLIAVGT